MDTSDSSGRLRISAIDALVLLRNAADEVVVPYDPRLFITTAKGNKISRSTILIGHKQIVLQRNVVLLRDVIIRGDIERVKFGRYVHVARGAVLRPAYFLRRIAAATESAPPKRALRFCDFRIGKHVMIGEEAIVEAKIVGDGVYIGRRAIIGRGAILKDYCWICDGAVLPPLSMVPNFAIMAGVPAVQVGELPECAPELARERCERRYENFQPVTPAKRS